MSTKHLVGLLVPLLACASDPAGSSTATTDTGSESSSSTAGDTTTTTATTDASASSSADTTTASSTADASTGDDASSGDDTSSSDDGSSEGDGTSDGDSSSTGEPARCGDGAAPYTICGHVTSSIAPLHDGIGTLWVVVTGSCAGLVDEQIVGIEDADFSAIGNTVPFSVDVAPGTWYIAAFLDENANGNPSFPSPSSGDLANVAGPMQLTCVQVQVADDVAEVEYELDAVL